MNFLLKKLIEHDGDIYFQDVDEFKDTDYESVTYYLIQRFGDCHVNRSDFESHNTWFRPYSSDDEYVLECLG